MPKIIHELGVPPKKLIYDWIKLRVQVELTTLSGELYKGIITKLEFSQQEGIKKWSLPFEYQRYNLIIANDEVNLKKIASYSYEALEKEYKKEVLPEEDQISFTVEDELFKESKAKLMSSSAYFSSLLSESKESVINITLLSPLEFKLLLKISKQGADSLSFTEASHYETIANKLGNPQLTENASSNLLFLYHYLYLACQYADYSLMSAYLKKGADINYCLNGKESLLHLAVRRDDCSTMVQFLLDNNAQVDIQHCNTPLAYACINYQHEAAKPLLEAKADPNACLNSESYSDLMLSTLVSPMYQWPKPISYTSLVLWTKFGFTHFFDESNRTLTEPAKRTIALLLKHNYARLPELMSHILEHFKGKTRPQYVQDFIEICNSEYSCTNYAYAYGASQGFFNTSHRKKTVDLSIVMAKFFYSCGTLVDVINTLQKGNKTVALTAPPVIAKFFYAWAASLGVSNITYKENKPNGESKRKNNTDALSVAPVLAKFFTRRDSVALACTSKLSAELAKKREMDAMQHMIVKTASAAQQPKTKVVESCEEDSAVKMHFK